MKKIYAIAIFILIIGFLAATITSSSERLDSSVTKDKISINTSRSTPPGTVIWSQPVNCASSLTSSQLDTAYPFDSQKADDFTFTTDPGDITHVKWWGGYWNPGASGNFPPDGWNIYLYLDNGFCSPVLTGDDPVQDAIASWYIPYADSHEDTECGQTDDYDHWVELSPAFTPTVGQTYWIAIQAVMQFQPQWGWMFSTVNPGCPVVGGFPLLGTPYWTQDDTGAGLAFELYHYEYGGPVLSVTPSTYVYPDHVLGVSTPGTQIFTIENLGTGNITIDPAPYLTGDPEFTITNDTGAPYPTMVNPPVEVTVQFDPNAVGSYSTTLTVITDAGTEVVPISGECVLPPEPLYECPMDLTIWNQPLGNPGQGWSAATSCEALGYLVYEDFWGLTDQICDIHWWGLNLFYDAGWTECSTANTFNIVFYDNIGGLPGNVICSYLGVTPTKTVVPNSDVDYGYWVYDYSYILDPCCDLTEGWVSIQNTETDCYFLWMNSPWAFYGYDGDEMAYQWDGSDYSLLEYDLAYCLTESEIVQPDPPLNITITTTPNGVNTDVHLEWDAVTGATYYTVYKSSDPYAPFPSGWTVQQTSITNTYYDYTSHNPPTFYRVTASN